MTERALDRLNAAPEAETRKDLLACLNIGRWVDELISARPYADSAAVLDVARTAAHPFSEEEIAQALSRHPRIGESPAGSDAESQMSQSEQSGVDAQDAEVTERLRKGNLAYEEKFDRVFLIRAAGRDAQEILAALEQRLTNDKHTELTVVAQQLREIAVLRLEGLLDS